MSEPTTSRTYLRIGQIARRSGVSAKALRLYEQRGLLKPCTHSEAGYRLYGPEALRSLMQIIVLKRSGFTLAEIADLRSAAGSVVAALLSERIAALQRTLAEQEMALSTLRQIAERVGSASTLDLDQLLESITMTSNSDMHLSNTQRKGIFERAEKFSVLHTPDEQKAFRKRVEQRMEDLGPAAIEVAQRSWRELSAHIRAAMGAGVPATSTEVAELARRWHAQVSSLRDKDPNFLTKLRELYVQHPQLMEEQSMSPAMMDYMEVATASAGLNLAR